MTNGFCTRRGKRNTCARSESPPKSPRPPHKSPRAAKRTAYCPCASRGRKANPPRASAALSAFMRNEGAYNNRRFGPRRMARVTRKGRAAYLPSFLLSSRGVCFARFGGHVSPDKFVERNAVKICKPNAEFYRRRMFAALVITYFLLRNTRCFC